jgi:hypothetical protein
VFQKKKVIVWEMAAMDPFSNSDMFQNSTTNKPTQSRASFFYNDEKPQTTQSQFGSNSALTKASEFSFTSDARQDNFFSPSKNDKLVPLSNKFSADTGLRQRNTMTKYSVRVYSALPSFPSVDVVLLLFHMMQINN